MCNQVACVVPNWRLPTTGHVAGLVTEGGEKVGVVHVAPCAHASSSVWVLDSGAGGGFGLSRRRFKKVRLSRRTPASLVCQGALGDQPRPRVWKRLRVGVSSPGADDVAGRRQLHDQLRDGSLVHDKVGVG